MVEKESALITKQLESLGTKNFDLEEWKSHKIIYI